MNRSATVTLGLALLLIGCSGGGRPSAGAAGAGGAGGAADAGQDASGTGGSAGALGADASTEAQAGSSGSGSEAGPPTYPPIPGAPYPTSPLISKITWDFAGEIDLAPGSDLWPATWGSDGNVYLWWGDGGGFGGSNTVGRTSMGFAEITGTPPNISDANSKNIWGNTANADYAAQFGGKVAAVVSINGVFYALAGIWPGSQAQSTTTSGSPSEARWISSSNMGQTWQEASWTFADASNPAFCAWAIINFGKDYQGARDNDVYVYGGLAWWAWPLDPNDPTQTDGIPDTKSYLARVPVNQILTQSAYQYFAGLDSAGAPIWGGFAARKPVFTDAGHRMIQTVVYNPVLKRYITTTQGEFVGQLGVFESTEPWGPWHTIAYYSDWGGYTTQASLTMSFVDKWTSADGLTMWGVYSGSKSNTPGGQSLDGFHLIRATLTHR